MSYQFVDANLLAKWNLDADSARALLEADPAGRLFVHESAVEVGAEVGVEVHLDDLDADDPSD